MMVRAHLLTLVLVAACRTPGAGVPPSPAPNSPRLDPEIESMVSSVSEQRLSGTVQNLVAFGTRHTCADLAAPGRGIAAARAFLKSELSALPALTVAEDPFAAPRCSSPVTAANVLASLPGRDPTRLVLVGGHYDSLALSGRPESREAERWSSADTPAPGADDSGSQAALVLEAARAMSGHSYDATVVFVAFAGEEQGLLGSKALAEHFQQYFPNARIDAVLNCDIVGGDASVNDAVTLGQFRLFAPGAPRETATAPDGTNDATSPSRGLARYVGYWAGHYVPAMTAIPRLREDRIGRGGDHEPFIAAGWPAVRFIETQENVSHQHTLDDVFANVTTPYLSRMTQVVVASAASLARAPRAPGSLSAELLGPGHVRLTWAPTPGAHHSVVAARPVGETYYRRRAQVPAGQAADEISATDFGMSSTEPFFVSVAAVDAAGHESLFAYPELRCDAKTCGAPPGSLEPTASVAQSTADGGVERIERHP